MEIKKLIKLQNAIIRAHQKIKDVQDNSNNQTKEIKSEFKKEVDSLNKIVGQLNKELNGFTKKEELGEHNRKLEGLKMAIDELNASLDKKISEIKLTPGKDGKNGLDGMPGKDGRDGKDGKDGKPGLDGKDGKDGCNGLSAYEIAVKQGFEGTEKEWIDRITNSGGKSYSRQLTAINQRINQLYEEIKEVPEDALTQASILKTIEECEQCTGEQVPAANLMAMTYNSIPRMVSEVENDAGYITEESDPYFTNSVAYSINQDDINNWNNKVEDDNYVHTDNNFTDELKNQITHNQIDIEGTTNKISNLNNNKADIKYVDSKVKMFHATIDNSSFQYVKGSADFTYDDVVNTENCMIEVQVANEKVYLKKQEFKNINPPDSIAGRYVGFSEIIRVAGEMAELFLFVYDHENLPTDEGSLNNLKDWGDYQYCVSSYQPVVMGNFLVKDIATNRAVDNNAPSSKATGDYVDSQCGVVLNYMQTTFAENIMTLVGLSYTKKPVIIYDDANGFEASNDDAGDTWHLTGLDLKPYKRLKFYVRSGGDGDANYSPSHIVEMHLDDRAKGSFGYFSADHAGHCPNNRNRHHMVTFIVNAEKTAIQFQHSISIYGTAASNSAGGRSCYLIEGYYD